MIKKKEDSLIRIRTILSKKHISLGRAAKKAALKHLKFGFAEDYQEALVKDAEKKGLCFALKVLDKACQVEMSV